MKRRLVLILFLFANPLWAAPLDISIASEKAILINGETGAVLFEKCADEKAFPASTTKIATVLYALTLMGEEKLDTVFTVSQNAIATITPQAKRQSNYRAPPHLLETDGTHMSLKKGEQLTFRELLWGAMLVSANDATNTIAENISGSIPEFMNGLNKFLKEEVGCQNTHFNNPHGLYHPDHYTTVYDMALIGKKAMQIPFFREMASQAYHTTPKTNFEYERKLVTNNALLKRGAYYYPKAIGIKTGYTSQCGRNIVAAAKDENRFLIGVILLAPSMKERYDDTKSLFEKAFTEKKLRHTVFPPSEALFRKTVPHGKGELAAYLPQGLSYDFYPSEKPTVKLRLAWDLPSLPIEKGAVVGMAKIVDENNKVLNEAPLYAKEMVKPKFFYSIKQKIHQRRNLLFWATAAFSLFIIVIALKQKGRRKKSRSASPLGF